MLAGELEKQGVTLTTVRMPWNEIGWRHALTELWSQGRDGKEQFVFLQYSALAWSRHGFSVPFLLVLGLFRFRKVRIVVIFHDVEPYRGFRLVDRVRRLCQRSVMRWSCRLSDKVILTIPIEHVSWLPAYSPKAKFIPVGANIPIIQTSRPTASSERFRSQ